MLIVIFCWADSATGQTYYANKSTGIATQVSAQTADNSLGISASAYHVDRPSSDLHRKPLSQRALLLPRLHAYANSLLASASTWWVPSYTLTTESSGGICSKWRSAPPIAQRLQQINWLLHSPAQQSRTVAWKESNLLYRGSLTYDS